MERGRNLEYACSLLICAALTACGGGGSDSAAPTAPTISAAPVPAPATYTIGGTASTTMDSLLLKLQNNGGDDLELSSAGAFTFAKALPAGTSYSVTVAQDSPAQSCSVSNGSGTVTDADVTNITVACVPAPGSVSLLHSFTGTDGADPTYSNLIQGSDGDFYGVTSGGGANNGGTAFKMTPAGILTVLHSFDDPNNNPAVNPAKPQGSLIQGSDGNFYGVTTNGGLGTSWYGTVFQMTPAGAVTELHAFSSFNDGAYPVTGLVQGVDGNLYGTAYKGGPQGAPGPGLAFRVAPDGTGFKTLYKFLGQPDGKFPFGGLMLGSDGNFYGMTLNGGTSDNGTVYQMTPAGAVTLLHSFAGGVDDGAAPKGALLEGTDGNFYGMTQNGGASNNGTVFEMTPAGDVTLLHSFAGGATDGAVPVSSLTLGSDGNFYGMTSTGGISDDGTVYQMTPAGVVTLLHSFAGGATDGATPLGSLIEGSDGHLYGMTSRGGANDNGTIFRVN